MRRIILVDHGSRVAAANQAIEKLGASLDEVFPDADVVTAHMELAEPSYADCLAAAEADPALRRLAVLPLFFTAGKHYVEDIVGPLNGFRRRRSDVAVDLLPPLAEQDAFFAFLQSRAHALLHHS